MLLSISLSLSLAFYPHLVRCTAFSLRSRFDCIRIHGKQMSESQQCDKLSLWTEGEIVNKPLSPLSVVFSCLLRSSVARWFHRKARTSCTCVRYCESIALTVTIEKYCRWKFRRGIFSVHFIYNNNVITHVYACTERAREHFDYDLMKKLYGAQHITDPCHCIRYFQYHLI